MIKFEKRVFPKDQQAGKHVCRQNNEQKNKHVFRRNHKYQSKEETYLIAKDKYVSRRKDVCRQMLQSADKQSEVDQSRGKKLKIRKGEVSKEYIRIGYWSRAVFQNLQ